MANGSFKLVFLLGILWVGWQPNYACNYASKMRLYHKYLDRYLNDPSVGNASLLCNLVRGIELKFKNKPGKPTPPIPGGLNCAAVNNGGGRGGGPGAVVVGIGQGVGSFAWVRNHNAEACEFTWTITPEASNPAGFSLSATTGMISVPGLSSAPVFFDIMVDPSVPDGTMAFFRVTWVDGCTGLPLFDEWADFKVTADAQISVVPVDPLYPLLPGGPPLVMSFRVTNHTPAPISRPYTYFHLGDPASLGNLNSGGTYQINNVFPVDKSVTGGVADVPALGELIIDKVPLLPGEFCDPEMINCCGLDFGGATCCGIIINDDLGPRPIPPLFQDLVGFPEGGGFIGFQVDRFMVQVPTNALTPLPLQLEQLALQGLNMAQQQNGFNFMPMLDEFGMFLMAPPGLDVQFFSTDPGLQWQPLLPPVLPLLPEFPETPELILQLVAVVNGWTPPPLPPPPSPNP